MRRKEERSKQDQTNNKANYTMYIIESVSQESLLVSGSQQTCAEVDGKENKKLIEVGCYEETKRDCASESPTPRQGCTDEHCSHVISESGQG